MESLNFKTNIKTYCINDDASKAIAINTTDYAILDRIKKSLKSIEQIEQDYKDKTINNDDEANTLFVEADAKVRDQINYIFGSDVCSNAFGNVNCLSLCDDGSTLFENFLNAIVPIIRKDITNAQKKQSKRIDKYVLQAQQFSK